MEIKIYGIVQGVGFRPFIHKLVKDYKLNGWVKNTASGVVLEVEGLRSTVESFLVDIKPKSPVLAVIERVETQELDQLMHYCGFEIIKSDEAEIEQRKFTLISPDVCICDDCRDEMMDAADRRYRYPFINCTNCGPRFTIIKDIPYDRDKTTMQQFVMCKDCSEEYADISSRRYHAQPDCCFDCGPQLFFIDNNGNRNVENPIETAVEYILDNKIVAIKGIGGIHLSCRADNVDTVQQLRRRKHRDEKPFAIMCRDLDTVRKWCLINEEQAKLLESHRRPIVLLEKANDKLEHISTDNNFIGVMLPYTPVHYLLLEKELDTVVMTSGNISDTPILYENAEALEGLSDIADGFLLNDRQIHIRCDDSLMHVFEGKEYPLRRSRGYAPLPIKAGLQLKSILSCGAEQKAGFALAKQDYVFNSQHIGDMKNIETYESYVQQIEHFKRLFDIKPEIIACDLHPDYMSTEYAETIAQQQSLKLHRIQHHHAHMASCMADNMLEDEEVIGIVWDGTGYGTDGQIWGGEFFLGNYSGFQRIASIRPVRLPGGDKATKEISRIADSMLYDVFGCIPNEYAVSEEYEKIEIMLKNNLNCPAASSIGRLFDGISALAGIKTFASYEGQGAIAIEGLASKQNANTDYRAEMLYNEENDYYAFDIYEENKIKYFDWRPMVKGILEDKKKEISLCSISVKFMNTLACMSVELLKDSFFKKVVLSGGVFQNMYLLKKMKNELTSAGFTVYTHSRVSTNDEGIALGQLFIAQYGGSELCV